MKTTLEIPDELYRAVKAKAANEGRKVTDVVAEGMRLVTERPLTAGKRADFPIFKGTKRKDKPKVEDFVRAEEMMFEEEVERAVQLMRR